MRHQQKFVTFAAAIAITAASVLAGHGSAQTQRPVEESRVEKTVAAGNVDSARVSVWAGNIRIYADSPSDMKVTAVRHVEGGTAEERHR